MDEPERWSKTRTGKRLVGYECREFQKRREQSSIEYSVQLIDENGWSAATYRLVLILHKLLSDVNYRYSLYLSATSVFPHRGRSQPRRTSKCLTTICACRHQEEALPCVHQSYPGLL
jgi:hypothetical protein